MAMGVSLIYSCIGVIIESRMYALNLVLCKRLRMNTVKYIGAAQLPNMPRVITARISSWMDSKAKIKSGNVRYVTPS